MHNYTVIFVLIVIESRSRWYCRLGHCRVSIINRQNISEPLQPLSLSLALLVSLTNIHFPLTKVFVNNERMTMPSGVLFFEVFFSFRRIQFHSMVGMYYLFSNGKWNKISEDVSIFIFIFHCVNYTCAYVKHLVQMCKLMYVVTNDGMAGVHSS